MASSQFETHGRINLALSILNNADTLGAECAVTEARLALEGATITDLVELRALASAVRE